MPEMDGIRRLRETHEIDPHLLCSMITGEGTIRTAVEAMGAGPFDYVLNPVVIGMLTSTVSRAMSVCRLQRENAQLREFHKDHVDSARDVIHRLSPDCVTALNPAFETLTGWSRTEWAASPSSTSSVPLIFPLPSECFSGHCTEKSRPPLNCACTLTPANSSWESL